ncbi:MAG: hypothetical protein KJ065_12555 [Anaerolineae bacterium]|nr:hypothetical protein [Anaerolineae bacterium]
MKNGRISLTFLPRMIAIIVATLAVGWMVQQLARYAIDFPFYDQWDTSLDIAQATQAGQLTPALLFRQHVEHRIIWTNLTTAAATWLDNWSMTFERATSIVVAVLIVILVVALEYRANPKAAWVILAPVTALIFGVRGRATYLQSFYNVFLFSVVFAIAAIYVLYRWRVGWRALIGALVLAVCNTFALGSGMMIWPALGVSLWLRGYRRWSYYAIWGAVAAVTLVLYFIGFDSTGGQSSLHLALQNPMAVVRYVLGFLGAPFVVYEPGALPPALAIGAIGLVLFALNGLYLWLTRQRSPAGSAWLGLAVYALALAGITAIGRLPLFLGESSAQPLSERYYIHSVMLWIALVALAALNTPRQEFSERARYYGRLLLATNVLVGMVLSVMFIYTALRMADEEPFPPRAATDCVYGYLYLHGDTSCFWWVYPPMFDYVPGRVEQYAAQRFGPFAAPTQQIHLTRNTLDQGVSTALSQGLRVFVDDERTQLDQAVPGRLVQRVMLPATTRDARFTTTALADGTYGDVALRVLILHRNGDTETVYEGLYAIGDVNPLSITVDLLPYAGEAVWLILDAQTVGLALIEQIHWYMPMIAVASAS